MEKTEFYRCKGCETLLVALEGGAPRCCGGELEPIAVNAVEASTEKHIPALKFENGKLRVQVGEMPHPMVPDHHIMWVYVQTRSGGMFERLSPQGAPEAVFAVEERDVVAVYEFCNLHGLWVAEVQR